METNSLVSIIMPVYNTEQYIESSIKSVVRQTYHNIELILIDDGSLDHSVEIAEKILLGSKITYQIIRQKNTGQGSARNLGLRIAKGEWICFLDSDDMLSDNAVDHLMSAADRDTVDLVFSAINNISDVSDAIRICNNGKVVSFSQKELQFHFLKRTKVILAPGSIYRKDFLINNSLFFENIPWSEDQHFIWRVLYHIKGAVWINEPLYQYFHHPGSIMTASKVQAIVDSYSSICSLAEYYSNDVLIGNYIVPRWVMGTINSSAKFVDFDLWKQLWIDLEGKKNYKILFSFPDKKVKIMACIARISLALYYNIVRKRK